MPTLRVISILGTMAIIDIVSTIGTFQREYILATCDCQTSVVLSQCQHYGPHRHGRHLRQHSTLGAIIASGTFGTLGTMDTRNTYIKRYRHHKNHRRVEQYNTLARHHTHLRYPMLHKGNTDRTLRQHCHHRHLKA